MLSVDVYVDAAQQRAFRRRAIAAFKDNKEYMEVLFIQRGVGNFHIKQFHRVTMTIQDDCHLDVDPVEYQALRNEAHNLGLEFGTVHTHISGDAAPSEVDWQSGADDREAHESGCAHTGGKARPTSCRPRY